MCDESPYVATQAQSQSKYLCRQSLQIIYLLGTMEDSEDVFSVELANYTTDHNDTSELDFGEGDLMTLITVSLFLGKERQIFVFFLI